ncbi:hypothetical protein A1Q2_04524 [Trichosporon asahii var. asahii CBS 8904]|uniref:Uncharacterized protein n=2 Tax=Trichosporon asahii var. asahii TaxID=189963 RepID=K1VKC1_TRIAC|nr:hypothetical protein A1Q1_00636 [Trichosporon asahii var. asahii CBS 2479]EJT50169.1 hypothetical protein A1Q1_00636 [Trichosporon asahii var. asahii CBS 2479]EKD01201.1 hypothetical protein A1Q2_04524 [Trichosporon asahii var. asahii CBS 8904]
MLKSLVLLSVLAIGATAQFEGIDGLTALPKECESQCAAVEAVAPQCVNMDNKCLEAVCAPCLDCAKMGAMYDTLVQSCQYLGLGGGGASGSASGSAGVSSASPLLPGADADNSGAAGLVASAAGIGAAALLAACF